MLRLKKSDLRDRILELLKDTGSHPTASWVYDRLREEFPRVAVGSVYRNLNILISEGRIRGINFDEPLERYDANLEEHYHFICEKCGEIHDLDVPIDTAMEKTVADKTGFRVLHHRFDFYGVCRKCGGG